MDRIRYFADLSVKRACGFGVLAIVMVMLGLSNDLHLAIRTAAILFSLQVAVLLHFAWRAPRIHYRKREVWILLDGWHGLPETRAHQAISTIMRDTFLGYAELGAWVATGFWLMSFTGRLLG